MEIDGEELPDISLDRPAPDSHQDDHQVTKKGPAPRGRRRKAQEPLSSGALGDIAREELPNISLDPHQPGPHQDNEPLVTRSGRPSQNAFELNGHVHQAATSTSMHWWTCLVLSALVEKKKEQNRFEEKRTKPFKPPKRERDREKKIIYK
ncbi:hypothetical protein MJO29_008124 [Puccinia striiformis f. sp. tritici]|nr:hypothetical protein MJO29_008124 [Puccinia striiformis f. sp. tritici]